MKRSNKLYEAKAILAQVDRALLQIVSLGFSKKDIAVIEKPLQVIADSVGLTRECLDILIDSGVVYEKK